MNPRLLTTLAIAASSLILTACGQSNQPAKDSQAQPAPATAPQAAPQAAVAAAPAAAPASTTTAPVQVPAAAPAAVAPVVAAAHAPAAAAPAAAAGPAAVMAAHAGKLMIQGFAAPVPAGWTPSQPSSSMRVAQFALPAAAGAEPGEVAAYYFPSGQGGSHEANIARWASQFATADGKPVAPKTSTSKNGDTEVTLVELQGTYARGVGMGPTGDAKPDQTLMIAMVEVPTGRITLQMYGPNKTVAAQRDSFVKLAKGFRPA
jgi:hypothetical protein